MRSKRKIAEELLSASLVSTKVFWADLDELIIEGQNLLSRSDSSIYEIKSVMRSLNYIWTLCSKWKRSSYISKDEKSLINQYWPTIHNLYFDLNAKISTIGYLDPLPAFNKPRTFDQELADIFTELGIADTLLEQSEDDSTNVSAFELDEINKTKFNRERLDRENPLPKFSNPKTFDPELASIFADVGVSNTLLIEINKE